AIQLSVAFFWLVFLLSIPASLLAIELANQEYWDLWKPVFTVPDSEPSMVSISKPKIICLCAMFALLSWAVLAIAIYKNKHGLFVDKGNESPK
ncbi:MAG: hypothetical protein AAGA30_13935, partial [Planctomycetota bacterium]